MINWESTLEIVAGQPRPPPVDISLTQNTWRLPLVGSVFFVKDKEGQLCVAGVCVYWILGISTLAPIALWPAYDDGLIPIIVVYGYYAVSALCLLSLIRASLSNPGRIPDFDEEQHTGWNRCAKCERMRPPRAHHCRRCGQCVMKMDHHCPWINNCVGEANHFLFIQLLVYACLMGLYAFVVVMMHWWVWGKCVSCDQDVWYIKHGVWFIYLDVVLAINITIATGQMLCTQHWQIIMNKTTLEKLMKLKSTAQYTVSILAYKAICGGGSVWCWWNPCRRKLPLVSGDGSFTV